MPGKAVQQYLRRSATFADMTGGSGWTTTAEFPFDVLAGRVPISTEPFLPVGSRLGVRFQLPDLGVSMRPSSLTRSRSHPHPQPDRSRPRYGWADTGQFGQKQFPQLIGVILRRVEVRPSKSGGRVRGEVPARHRPGRGTDRENLVGTGGGSAAATRGPARCFQPSRSALGQHR